MALVFEKTKLRPQPPRLKNVRRRLRVGQRSRNQDAKGRWVKGNNAPKGKRLKAIIRRQLGHDATGELVERLYAETRDMHRALVRALGAGAEGVPQVQDTLARRARWGVLGAWYALRAVELGLGTEAGDAALEMAIKLDARAERLDVTALDLADRLATDDDAPQSMAQEIEAETATETEGEALSGT